MMRRVCNNPFKGLVAGIALVSLAWMVVPVLAQEEKPVEGAPTGQAVPAGGVEAGKKVYEKRCVHCHGVEGRGDGVGADRFRPRPANFARAKYKYASTQKDELPTDEDLFITVSQGLPYTGMPAWEGILSEQERKDVVQYIKTFSDKFAEATEPPKPIAFGTKVPPSAESIAKGKDLFFNKAECNRCHGDEGRADGKNASELAVWPRNFTKGWTFRRSNAPEEIFQRITRGIIVMPSFAAGENVELTEEERWHVANYVHSLSQVQGTPDWKVTLVAKKVAGTLPDNPDDPAWEAQPRHDFPLVGQVTMEPRQFTPTIDLVTVKALYNDQNLSLLVVWDDPTNSIAPPAPPVEETPAAGVVPGVEGATPEGAASTEGVTTEGAAADSAPVEAPPAAEENGEGEAQVYDDRIGLQFPAKMPESAEKPYFIMGDPDHAVQMVTWNAGAASTAGGITEEINARGPKEITKQEGVQFVGKGQYKNGQYRLVLTRPLTTGDADDIQIAPGTFVPIAFSAWDGTNGDHDTARSVSAWYHLLLELPTPPTRYIYPTIIAFLVVLAEVWIIAAYKRKRKGS
jgi:mono/diheme cytochrome c family protein